MSGDVGVYAILRYGSEAMIGSMLARQTVSPLFAVDDLDCTDILQFLYRRQARQPIEDLAFVCPTTSGHLMPVAGEEVRFTRRQAHLSATAATLFRGSLCGGALQGDTSDRWNCPLVLGYL